jgi:predicted lipoprotein with Yx(FWY)xxD motif
MRRVRRRSWLVCVAPFGVTATVACGSTQPLASPSAPLSSPSSATSADPASMVATVDMATTPVGTVLTDSHGHTLYYLSTEASGQDACTLAPGCASMWPGLVPPRGGIPVPGIGVNGTLGVIGAADGSAEVTYNGWPLHTFSGETAGRVTGQGIVSYGGIWSVATPGMASASDGGAGDPLPGLITSPPMTPPGSLPTNPFAPTTPPGTPAPHPLPTIPAVAPLNPF